MPPNHLGGRHGPAGVIVGAGLACSPLVLPLPSGSTE